MAVKKRYIKVLKFICERCGHEWQKPEPVDKIPLRCAGCKTPYWNIPPGQRLWKPVRMKDPKIEQVVGAE